MLKIERKLKIRCTIGWVKIPGVVIHIIKGVGTTSLDINAVHFNGFFQESDLI